MVMGKQWNGIIKQYHKFLPVGDSSPVVSLNEGNTPLIYASYISALVGDNVRIFLKYEGMNPTGSFKARGLSAAVSNLLGSMELN